MEHKDVLIVDGYNILHVWVDRKWITAKNRDDARLSLIHLLADYQGLSGKQIILVFDAHSVANHNNKTEYVNKLEVQYSAYEQTADVYIESLVGDLVAQGRRVSVATGDHLEQIIVLAKGGARITPRELWQMLQNERTESAFGAARSRRGGNIRKYRGESGHTGHGSSTIDSRLSEEQRAIMERMRRGDD